MKYERSWTGVTGLLRACGRAFPDLLAVLAYVGLMDAVLVSSGLEGPARVLIGLPLLVFVPGYGLLAALFPRRQDDPGAKAFAGVSVGALTTFERTALSFGVSVALLPLLALALDLLGTGFGAETILVALNLVVFATVVVAAIRRMYLLETEQFAGSGLGWFTRRLSNVSSMSRFNAAVTALLVVTAVVAMSSLAVALVAPNDGEQYTNVALLSENESGALVAGDYPTDIERGERASLTVAVENREQRTVDYTLVGELQRVDRSGGSIEVLEETEVARASRTVEHGETWNANASVSPTMTGEGLRLVYHVYRGEAPSDASVDTDYRHVHLWTNVTG